MEQRRTFGMTELCEMSGAKPTQAEHWCRLGIIVPLQDAPGRGTYRVFSLANIIEAAQAVNLAALGLSGKQLQQIFAVQRQKNAAAGQEHRAFVALQWFTLSVRAIATVMHHSDVPPFVALISDCEALIKSVAKAAKDATATEPRALRHGVDEPDDQILLILAARAAERAAAVKDAR